MGNQLQHQQFVCATDHVCIYIQYICMYIFIIMKKMCHPNYYQNDFAATLAIGHMMYIMYIFMRYMYIMTPST